MVLLTNLIGTEDMIRERLKAFRDAGVNTFRLGTGGVSWKERTAATGRSGQISFNAKPQAGRRMHSKPYIHRS